MALVGWLGHRFSSPRTGTGWWTRKFGPLRRRPDGVVDGHGTDSNADWISDIAEVLESNDIRAEKVGDLDSSDDGTFRSGLHRGGRHNWDQRRHPDLQAHRAGASGSYAPPPWTPSCHRSGARETLA
jgi:hypothetical protein